jgi:hypothetical protein
MAFLIAANSVLGFVVATDTDIFDSPEQFTDHRDRCSTLLRSAAAMRSAHQRLAERADDVNEVYGSWYQPFDCGGLAPLPR